MISEWQEPASCNRPSQPICFQPDTPGQAASSSAFSAECAEPSARCRNLDVNTELVQTV